MDAIWFHKKSERYTIYLVGLRAVDEDTLHFLRPVIRPGSESRKQWQEIIEEIPEETRKRILVMVSDSFRGAGYIAKAHGWFFQRCQAHLLLSLEKRCGSNKRVLSWWEGRQRIKRLAFDLMNLKDEQDVLATADQYFLMGQDKRCPVILRQIITETLRHLEEFRTCYLYPELRLPGTTNALENTNGRIRSLLNRSRGCRTPESLIKWITGFLWFNPTVTCRPKRPTELRR
jgi:transposase-like protein